jgi:hypothetical protein
MGLFDSGASFSSSLGSATSAVKKRLEIAVATSLSGVAPAVRTINLPTAQETVAANTVNDFTDISAQSALTTFNRSTQAVASVPAIAIPTAQSNRAVAAKVLKDQDTAREAILASVYSSLFVLITAKANAGLFSVTDVKLAENQYRELNTVLVKYGYVISTTGTDIYTISWA